MLYIQIRFAVGSVFGEKIENFYTLYPVILLYLISNSNVGKLTQLLDNNDQVDLHMKYGWVGSEVMTPFMLAIKKQDMKILCILIAYDERLIEATISQVKNACIECTREERRAVTLCQRLVKKKYGNNLQVAILQRLQRCLDCQQLFIQTLIDQEKEFLTCDALPYSKKFYPCFITELNKKANKKSLLLSDVTVLKKQQIFYEK